MNKSEHIGALVKALAAMQGELQDLKPNSKSHRNKYADLGAMLQMARPLLAKNGLAFTTLPSTSETVLTLECVLAHESGEYISSTFSVPIPEDKAMNKLQSIGSAMTYGRRYVLGAFLNFTKDEDDDDGESYGATNQQNQAKQYQNAKQGDSAPVTITAEQIKELRRLIDVAGIPLETYLEGKKLSKLEEVRPAQFTIYINMLHSYIKGQQPNYMAV